MKKLSLLTILSVIMSFVVAVAFCNHRLTPTRTLPTETILLQPGQRHQTQHL